MTRSEITLKSILGMLYFLASFSFVNGQNIELFQKSLYEYVLPATVPTPNNYVDTLFIRISPGEYEPISFVLRSTDQDINAISAGFSALTGPSTIPKNKLDLRITKVWLQGGYDQDIDTANPVLVPELLVYNDIEVLKGTFISNSKYIPPAISKTIFTHLKQGESKEFWYTIEIDKSTNSGSYSGNIWITQNADTIKTIPVVVEVVPIALRESDKHYVMYYTRPQTYPDSLFDKEMIDMKRHGYNGIHWVVNFRDDELASLNRILSKADEHQFPGMIVVNGTPRSNADSADTRTSIAQAISTFKQYNRVPYLQAGEEPNQLNKQGDCQKSHRCAIRKSYEIHQAGGKTMLSIGKVNADYLDDPNSIGYDQIDPVTGKTFKELGITNEIPDVVDYHGHLLHTDPSVYTSFTNYITGLQNGTIQRRTDRIEMFYWQTWVEKPCLNRMSSGFWLWTSKLDGIMPFTYQKGPNQDGYGDFFTDFDNKRWSTKDQMLTHPALDGPIPTTKWEAMRDGIDDMRYLETLYHLMDSLQSSNPTRIGEIRTEMNEHLKKYYDLRSYDSLCTNNSFQNTRDLLIDRILEIQGHTTGINENEQPDKNVFAVTAYPNPAKDQVVLKLNGKKTAMLYYEIKDALGKIAQQGQVKGSNKVIVNTSNLRKGIYFYELKLESGELGIGKLIIE